MQVLFRHVNTSNHFDILILCSYACDRLVSPAITPMSLVKTGSWCAHCILYLSEYIWQPRIQKATRTDVKAVSVLIIFPMHNAKCTTQMQNKYKAALLLDITRDLQQHPSPTVPHMHRFVRARYPRAWQSTRYIQSTVDVSRNT